ncbi:hypothetical protein C8J57DRAFT_1250776 [Mycena rebaudengoi]|nr:hypothetical protein C8J57DRAFT_1250776 [Mycena rebaudengoi]
MDLYNAAKLAYNRIVEGRNCDIEDSMRQDLTHSSRGLNEFTSTDLTRKPHKCANFGPKSASELVKSLLLRFSWLEGLGLRVNFAEMNLVGLDLRIQGFDGEEKCGHQQSTHKAFKSKVAQRARWGIGKVMIAQKEERAALHRKNGKWGGKWTSKGAEPANMRSGRVALGEAGKKTAGLHEDEVVSWKALGHAGHNTSHQKKIGII